MLNSDDQIVLLAVMAAILRSQQLFSSIAAVTEAEFLLQIIRDRYDKTSDKES